MREVIQFVPRQARHEMSNAEIYEQIYSIGIPKELADAALEHDVSGLGDGPEILDAYQRGIFQGLDAAHCLEVALKRTGVIQ